jgi:hypothetical protein
MRRVHGKSSNVAEGRGQASIYRIWANIKQRCTNPGNSRYADYGGRGIALCPAWHDFAAFYVDVGDRPPGKSLDRIDNSRGYEPGNVRWADTYQQAQNSRRSVLVTIDGVAKPINVWCRELGLAYNTYKQRRRNGWSIERAVSTPPNQRHVRRHLRK